ncbi:cation/H(+) antiporter 15-like [Gastrolobium bilobum]|uniref:cation/H(+) antiporter 15-like n=1 Tax=Gastrolobium bilobum TaxID=150636 RepID=UPI002AB208A2|nr:cation/H(+) antiporter 15-like [Gastrolobium bilobum]
MAYVGLIYNIFLTALEMNLDSILQARRKATSIAIAGIFVPMALGAMIYHYYSQNFPTKSHPELALFNTPMAYLICSLALSVTSFPVLAQILSDLKIVYTQLGRVALKAATISDFYNWVMFVLLIPYAIHSERATLSILSTLVFGLFCYFALRPLLDKLLVEKTNPNEWDNYKLSYVIIGVFACAAVTELLGTHSLVGALGFGLIFPRGRFTELLMEKSDDLVSGYLAPLFFAGCGVRFGFKGLASNLVPVIVTVLLLCTTKIISTVIATRFYGMPFRDGVALGALMNTKGFLPLIILNLAHDKKIVSVEGYSTMVLSFLFMTLAVSPIINYIYKPIKRFEQNKQRTVQNLKAGAATRVLVCFHNTRQATGMTSILEACNGINVSPLNVFAVQLVELKGRATNILAVHHDQTSSHQSQEDFESFVNVFTEYASSHDRTSVETLTAVSPYGTIHKDIYSLADDKQASLILLPFHKQSSAEGTLEIVNITFKEINQSVVQDAPCSLGIFVDRGLGLPSKINWSVAMIFIGGPDDREALAIAWRMSRHPRIQLSMVRVLLFGKAAEADTSARSESRGLFSTVIDNDQQKELDEDYVNLFRLMAVHNEDSISYAEKEVHSGDDIPKVLTELDQGDYDLYVLGQGKGRNSQVMSQLLEWTDCPELGVLGDMLASNSFGSRSSLLVVQQYGFGGMGIRSNNTQASNMELSKDEDLESPFVKAQ